MVFRSPNPLDLLKGTAICRTGGRTNTCPKDSNEQITFVDNRTINYFLRTSAKFWSSMSFPTQWQ